MYCCRCGVRLQDGAGRCPLCGTPVPSCGGEEIEKSALYSDRYPSENRHGRFFALGIATVVMAAVCAVCLILCLKTYGRVFWSGYVMLGLALAWIVLILPLWFRRRNPLIFIPVDFAAAGGYLLYICLYNRQSWFLSFAFPVVALLCILSETAAAMFLHITKGRLYITGGLMIAAGASCMLIEFFEHLTFGTPMFAWSLYGVSLFSVLGLFLIAAAVIPPLRSGLERRFFF